MKVFRTAIAALALVLALPTAASAGVAAAGPGGFAAGFATPVVVIEKGEGITFYNGDVPQHDFVATDAFVPRRQAKRTKWCSGFRRGRCPLFWSPKIGAGQSTAVLGLQRVKPGKQYGFFCSLHPNMKGTLVVR
jgi:plastocyanin